MRRGTSGNPAWALPRGMPVRRSIARSPMGRLPTAEAGKAPAATSKQILPAPPPKPAQARGHEDGRKERVRDRRSPSHVANQCPTPTEQSEQ